MTDMGGKRKQLWLNLLFQNEMKNWFILKSLEMYLIFTPVVLDMFGSGTPLRS